MTIFKLFLAVVFLTSSSLVQANSEAKKEYRIKWILAHEPIAVFEMAAKYFSEKVYKESNGQLIVEIIGKKDLPHNQIPLPSAAFRMLVKGDYQMSQTYTSFLGQHVKDMWALESPFLFRDHAHATRVLDGEIGQSILAQMDSHKVKGLAFTYSGGYRIVPSGKLDLNSSESFKNVKIRVSDNPLTSTFFRKLGAKPVVAFDEGVLEKGLDSFESTYARLDNIKPLNAAYILESNHSILLTALLINKEFFNSLPEKLQKIVIKVAKETAIFERDFAVKDGERSKQNYVNAGIQIRQFNKDDIDRLNGVAVEVQKENAFMFSKNLIESIKAK